MKDKSFRNPSQAKRGCILRGICKRIFVLLLLFFALFRVEFAQHRPSRIIDLKIVADEDFRQNQGWRSRTKQLVADSSKKFERCFGIKLNIKTVGYWFPSNGCNVLTDLFDDLINSVNKKDCDVVIGLTSRQYHEGDFFGLASYDQGYILIRRLSSKCLMKFTLEHELCHLFGALDRSEGKTVMNRYNLGNDPKFDGLTTELVLLNKFRNFQINLSPLSKSKLKDVISIYSQINEPNQGETDIHMLLAPLHLENGDYSAAIKECRLAKKINPAYPGINCIMGRANLLNGDIEAAIKELKTACKRMPDDYQAHSHLASAYLKMGKIKKAIEECDATIKINPCDANAYSCLGYAYLEKEKLKESKASCVRAISLDPNLPDTHNLLGIIFEKEDRIEDAKFEFQKALELKPDYIEAHANLGILYFKRNSFPESARHYKRVIEIDPDFAQAYYSLAVISFYRKEYALAQKYLLKGEELGVKISPNFKKDLFNKLNKK